ncbi:hypothetical protein [Stenotrophomonas sp. ATs4]|uniref:hypothetical protein n=1 Tax=Stenotrophomonas sp. ATs4 TaxID=3402766 RepID=UPI003F6F703E
MRLNLPLILLLLALPAADALAAAASPASAPPRDALLQQIDMGMANAVAWEYAFNAVASCDVARLDHALRELHDSYPVQIQPMLDAGYTATYRAAEPYPTLQNRLAALRDAEITCMAIADGRSHANVIDSASALLVYIADQPL